MYKELNFYMSRHARTTAVLKGAVPSLFTINFTSFNIVIIVLTLIWLNKTYCRSYGRHPCTVNKMFKLHYDLINLFF